MKSLNTLLTMLLFSALVSIIVTLYFGVDMALGVMCVSVGGMAFGKLVLCQMLSRGWGVFPVRGGKTIIGPNILVGITTLMGCVIAFLIHMTYGMEGFLPQTINNIRCFGWCVTSGWLFAIIYWFAEGRAASFHGSEYDARVEFNQKGYPPEIAEKKIQALREEGILPTN